TPFPSTTKHKGGNKTHHQLAPDPSPSVINIASYIPAGYKNCPYNFVGNCTSPNSTFTEYVMPLLSSSCWAIFSTSSRFEVIISRASSSDVSSSTHFVISAFTASRTA